MTWLVAVSALYAFVLGSSMSAFVATTANTGNSLSAAGSFGIVKVQSATGATTDLQTEVTATFSAPPAESNLLVAIHHRTVGTVTIPSGWSQAVQEGNLTIAYKVAGAGESTSVTFTTSPTSAQTVTVVEFSGTDPVSPLDQVASNSGGAILGVTSLSTGTTGTTAAGDQVVVAAIGTDGDAGGFANSWTNSFLGETEVLSTDLLLPSAHTTATRIVSVTGQFETTESWTTPLPAYGAVATFKAAP